jgi:hypothetical protein
MILIIQYDDRDVNQFNALIEKNKEYCKEKGYDYKFFSKGYENVPPYWRKVFLVKEFLNFYSVVVWVDTDAAIVSNEAVDTLFRPQTHFAFSPNPNLLHLSMLDMLSAPFCAGVWAVKSTPQGKTIMDYWSNSYNPKKWSLKDGKWIADCPYGGYCYEQGSFEIYIYRTANFNAWLSQWEHHKLNYLPRDDHAMVDHLCPSSIFAVHYWSGNRGHISKHFKLS